MCSLPPEADYIFVSNLSRVIVLTDQLEALKLDYQVFRYSLDPKHKCIVLVTFSDNVLDKAAEERQLFVQLSDKAQSLPFADAGRTRF